MSRQYYIMKRVLDVLVAIFFIILFLPVVVTIALLIKVSSKGPVFYVQKRIGLNGKLFSIIKFRTMVIDAESVRGPVLHISDDPRITKLGLFLRSTSLDEIPQLLNVLAGHMSLVGPRPLRPYFIDSLSGDIINKRLSVKPGLTGYWQVFGNDLCDSNINGMLRMDAEYINKQSLLFDLKILAVTLKKMFLRHNNAAY